MWSAPNAQDKIKVADVVVSTNHVTFLTNSFPRLISLLTSVIIVSGISGITAILKYRSVNPIPADYGIQWRCDKYVYCRMDRERGAGLRTLRYGQSGACLAATSTR